MRVKNLRRVCRTNEGCVAQCFDSMWPLSAAASGSAGGGSGADGGAHAAAAVGSSSEFFIPSVKQPRVQRYGSIYNKATREWRAPGAADMGRVIRGACACACARVCAWQRACARGSARACVPSASWPPRPRAHRHRACVGLSRAGLVLQGQDGGDGQQQQAQQAGVTVRQMLALNLKPVPAGACVCVC
jgi:hypothetical protein